MARAMHHAPRKLGAVRRTRRRSRSGPARRAASRLPRPADDVSEGDSWREALEADFVEAMPGASRPEGDDPVDREPRDAGERPAGDDAQPRKRRRRGRRGSGSRGRSQGDETGTRGERPPRPAPADQHGDDEPLPASYGSRPPARDDAGRSEPTASPASDDASRTRGRRRRSRRSGGEGRRESPPAQRSDRSAGRRGSRRDEPRPTRGRRSDFEPVAGRYDEDDEGLEFLGVEEAARSATPRPRAAEDDDVLTESGLTGVLDVPSWVEAIGIVIAGNLAGRSRSGRADGGKSR